MCTSWSSANQISNFKFSAFFRVLFALWSLKYPHPTSQQTPRVSTELGMVVNLSYSFIPLQKISQKGVDRSVENPQKRAKNTEMGPNAPNKFSWRMRNKMPLCYATYLYSIRRVYERAHVDKISLDVISLKCEASESVQFRPVMSIDSRGWKRKVRPLNFYKNTI